jgi:small-conductance mechanosensitive channel
MDFNAYWKEILNWLPHTGLRILVIIIITLIGLRLSRVVANRLFAVIRMTKPDEPWRKRIDTLASLIRNLLNVGILGVALVMLLDQLGIAIGPVLAAAGIVGVAVGFGSQQLVQDIISGFFILIDDQIRVGDVVNVAGKGGLVEAVTIRTTVLRDLSGNVHYVRNGHIDVVTNMTKIYSQYVFEIGVAYREDVDEVFEVIRKVDEELRKDPAFADNILEPIELLGLDQFADSAIIIKARTKTKPSRQWGVAREFNRRLKKAFDERNIEIPFPHVTLYMGEDKKGEAPPVNVRMRPQATGAA